MYIYNLDDNTEEMLSNLALDIEEYISHLQLEDGTPVIMFNRKTGFIGFIICLNNIFELFRYCKERVQLKYLLTYKLSQDFLENCFCAVRYRGGHNNNPTAIQFQSAFKRLLVRHELNSYNTGNCLAGGVPILTVSSTIKAIVLNTDNDFSCLDLEELISGESLSSFVEHVTEYIEGFVVKKLFKKIHYDICTSHLESNIDNYSLINIKKFGKWITPSQDVVIIMKRVESILRSCKQKNLLFNKNMKLFVTNNVMQEIYDSCSNTAIMQQHLISNEQLLNNHKYILIKEIIHCFLEIRFFHEGREISSPKHKIRHKLNKLVLFKHQ